MPALSPLILSLKPLLFPRLTRAIETGHSSRNPSDSKFCRRERDSAEDFEEEKERISKERNLFSERDERYLQGY